MSVPARTEVLTTSDARSRLTSIVAEFRRQGPAAVPVFFGSHRKAEAAVVPVAVVDRLLPLIEDLVIAEQVTERYKGDDGSRLSFDELVEAAGLDRAEFA
jgi:antitoxin StbD